MTFIKDLSYGFRLWLKYPLFTLMATLILSLGIGLNTTIFSLINTYVIQPLPFTRPDEIVAVWQRDARRGFDRNPVSSPNFRDWQSQNQVFEHMACYTVQLFDLAFTEGEAEHLEGARVSAALFPLLAVQPSHGRGFSVEEERPNSNRVVIISDGLWRRRFGGDPSVVNRQILVDGQNHTIIGVMAAGFKFPLQSRTEFWTPIVVDVNQEARGFRYLSVIARLKQNIQIGRARAEMNTIAQRLERDYPDGNAGWGVNVVPLHEDMLRDSKPALIILLCITSFVLLIACANVGNMLLARASSRQREIAIRLSLGAERWRLVRQLLTESLLLALVSGGIGLLLAYWAGKILLLSLPDVTFDRNFALDSNLLAFTVLASLISILLFGLAPALQASKADLNQILKDSQQTSGFGGARSRLRGALVVIEIALSMVMLVGAGVMIKSFYNLKKADPGFQTKNLLTAPISLPEFKYLEPAQRVNVMEQALQKIRSLPGVKTAGATSILPLGAGDRVNTFRIETRPSPSNGERRQAGTREITPGYFSTMGIPIVLGRDFTDYDNENSLAVAIVNETLVRLHFQGEDPLGKRITLSLRGDGPWFTIVGVAKDIKHSGLSAPPQAEIYGPYRQDPVRSAVLVARTDGPPESLINPVRQEIRNLDSTIPVYNISTMEQFATQSLESTRFGMSLLGVFAMLALTMAVIGLFSFMSYSVSNRIREIGIRAALGANQSQIVWLIVSEGMRLVLIGIAFGFIGAIGLVQILQSVLYDISFVDPLTFSFVVIILMLTSLLAILIPAYRASKADPMIALRIE